MPVDERAAQLHAESLVIDTMAAPGPYIHTEAMLRRLDELVGQDVDAGIAIDEMELMADRLLLRGELNGYWEGWERSGVDVGSYTIGSFGPQMFTYENAIRDVARWTRKFDVLDRFVKVTKAADMQRAHDDKKTGIVLNFQNTTHFGEDLSRLEQFNDLGVKIMQLTYNARNFVGDGCTERNPSGLSLFGIQVVERMNELGILVDVSHCSEPTQLDAARVSKMPIAITHGFSKTVHPHDRGASDDVIKAIGREGYVGIVAVPFFLTSEPQATLDHLVRHLDHVGGLVGADHVGIGTDWAAPVPKQLQILLAEGVRRIGFREEHRVDWGATLAELPTYDDWPNITRALVDAGYSDDEIRGFLGRNFLRLFGEVIG
jgi:membrane dipeptidase